MNKPNIKAEQLEDVFDGANYFIPATINGQQWVLNFESDGIDNEDVFMNALELALGLGGGISDFEKHLSLNGASERFVGGVKLENFLDADRVAYIYEQE